jgi:hypothetical protein
LEKLIILIPVYNDWRSLNTLIKKINFELNKENLNSEILIINDNSSLRNNFLKKKLSRIKKITFLNLKINVGSQRAINVGLNYINKIKENYIVTIMDSDGEDDPKEIVKMIKLADNHKNYIITSNRLARKESLIIRFLYRVHLIITFIITGQWISFGNFSTFNSKNIKKLIQNDDGCYAHSANVIKNSKIKRIYAKRNQRFFDKSKISFFRLIFHSQKIICVFQRIILVRSFVALFFGGIIYSLNQNIILFFLINIIFLLNITIIIIRIFIQNKNSNKIKFIVKKTQHTLK